VTERSVAPFEFAFHTLPCHSLRLADLLSGHSLGDDVSCLRTFAAAFISSKAKPHVSFFVVPNNTLALVVHKAQVELRACTSLLDCQQVPCHGL